ncbi:MAG: phosphoribosylglycinamide formyltransferase [Acidobacteriota bacterium]
MSKQARLGILLSGRGSNFLAIQQAIERGDLDARIVVVLSNRERAPGIAKARELGIDAVVVGHRGKDRRSQELELEQILKSHRVDWVCLAGYMRLLSSAFIDEFRGRVLNIHPSLLPAFPGLNAQKQAWEYGVKVSGCTVHLVDAGMDSGPIVGQRIVEVDESASAEHLSARILAEEHLLYPVALKALIQREWRIEGRRVVFLPSES